MVDNPLQLRGQQVKIQECLEITFSEALPSTDYVINLTTRAAGTIKVWETPAPTTTDFHVVTYNSLISPINCIFYCTVVAGMYICIKQTLFL